MTAPDEAVRKRIRTDLGSTLFVDAGAGSGKTTVLVDRIANLVASGVPMRHIAAVTFTEKAAAELRDRLREKLEESASEDALAELDTAAIGTLHAFARRVLSEHPIEVGLPPLIEVLDEVGSDVAAERRWNDLRTELLSDPEVAPLLRLGLAADMKLDHVRELVARLEANWDVVEERLAGVPPPPPRVDISSYLRRARALLLRRGECTDQSDALLERFVMLEEWLARAESTDDEAQLLDLVDEIPHGSTRGKAGAWGGQAKAIRDEMKQLHEDGKQEQREVVDRVLRCLLPRLAKEVLNSARFRLESGELRFHDLLVLARRLVRESGDARAALQQRYPRLLLDEAQDTDPIQIELAVRIAGGRDATTAAWTDVHVPAGSLFVVGDAKQSIYRFRRADISTYLTAQSALGTTLPLTTNFRSAPEVLTWLNGVFGGLIQARPSVQPVYEPLQVTPERATGSGTVTLLGRTPHPAGKGSFTADEVRAEEARDIAGLVVTALQEAWTVGERRDGWRQRAIRPDDITILLPYRTAISAIETALDSARVPYRTEAASIVYAASEVRELMTCLRAIDDPTDDLAVVATLRSSLFGCSDRELWRWHAGGGSWNLFAPRDAEEPVAEALDQLRAWSRARTRRTPSELLEEILERRRLLEAVVDSPRYHEVWRRLRFVVDQARAWSEAEHGSLREYLSWAARQAEDSARVTETVLPETDTRTVRITTIHASKGLQFPFVVVAGLSSGGRKDRPPVLWPPDGGVEAQLSAKLRTGGYDDADALERQIEHGERVRLLYVACTRAESHLAVSLHRKEVKPDKDDLDCVFAELLARGGAGLPVREYSAGGDLAWTRPEIVEPTDPLPAWDDWDAQHAASVENASVREAVSATAIAHGEVELPSFPPGLAKDPVDLELPPWLKGRYGTAVGRAVHAVLQTIDLGSGEHLRELAESQALAEGVPDAVSDIAAAVQSALDSEIVRRAAARPHWRETYVGGEVDGVLVEGYADLLYRDDDGLVLIDYKTDTAVGNQGVIAYQRQLQVYGRVLGDATGSRVAGLFLVFLRPTGAVVVDSPLATPLSEREELRQELITPR